ncbi:glycosyltransferase family 4 protein [Bacteroides eggerthii]|uniref:glycosyltransferase family 4 protein n=1 Tax=Bacteroides eggerthii TaxID=28111 RepID=UPI001C211888|nr:glycosyltransferase family 4 protein [Bacteroides eggerthii]MBU8972743.1 glycosyltransferase family 4 protein [Bacteroides eggerthii]MBU8997629.1 glycosyltransferase family 4 protein [Bacteroides eggerthii]MCG4759091.1 glycosyltransferase family 4 protein [Bacteroides eggerthii]
MHIAFLTTEYPILGMKCGGIGIFIKHLSHLIVKSEAGVKVSVVYWGNQFTETVWDDGIFVIPINQPHKSPFSPFTNRRHLNRKLNQLVAETGIDLIESIDWEGPLAFCKLSVPVVTRLHGSNVYFDYLSGCKTPWSIKVMEKNALHNSNAYIGVSRQALDLTGKLFNLPASKRTCVIYNPVDVKITPPDLINVNKKLTILYWGTIVEKKGVLDLPFIFNRICGQNDNIRLILIGQDAIVNGSSTWEKCNSLFSKQSACCVSYLGRMPYEKTMAYASRADICIFPSHAETFGLVLLEAMFLRKAIVCSDINCFQEIIGDSDCVCKCMVGNIDEFAEALQRLISDSSYRCELADRAYLNATTRFNTDDIVAQNIEFYNQVIRDSQKAVP